MPRVVVPGVIVVRGVEPGTIAAPIERSPPRIVVIETDGVPRPLLQGINVIFDRGSCILLFILPFIIVLGLVLVIIPCRDQLRIAARKQGCYGAQCKSRQKE